MSPIRSSAFVLGIVALLTFNPGAFSEETDPNASRLVGLPPSTPLEDTFRLLFPSEDFEKVSRPYANFRLRLNYRSVEGSNDLLVIRHPSGEVPVSLPSGEDLDIELAWEHIANKPARLRLWRPGDLEPLVEDIEDSTLSTGGVVLSPEETRDSFNFSADFTLMARFQTTGNGTLASRAPREGKWAPDGKAFFIRNGKLVYDIGWVGALAGKRKVNDGKPHTVVVSVKGGKASLFVDGKADGRKMDFSSDDDPAHVFKIGATATNFGGDFEGGKIETVQFWKRALSKEEIDQLSKRRAKSVNTPDYHWRHRPQDEPELLSFGAVPGVPATVELRTGEGFKLHQLMIQPLEASDHRELVEDWNEEAFSRGKQIYQSLCITCHGNEKIEGSIPLALKFHQADFKNGNDPYRMWQTIRKGYGLMMPHPQFTTRQIYDVIHYIREAQVKPSHSAQYFKPDEAFLADLPRGLSLMPEKERERRPPQYELMDFGNHLFWTYQIEPGPLEPGVNIAYKGLGIRLDEGPGGISRGKAWAVYDLDTMRLATFFTGDQFVDWKGIAFDGSHGTHTSLVGDRIGVSDNAPGWAHPVTGSWEDLRLVGRDGRHFGPLPRDWVRYHGLYRCEDQVLLRYFVGDTGVSEFADFSPIQGKPVFLRSFALGQIKTPLAVRLARDDAELAIVLAGDDGVVLSREDGWIIARLPVREEGFRFRAYYAKGFDEDRFRKLVREHDSPVDHEGLTTGLGKQTPGVVTTRLERGEETGAFAVDELTVPDADLNPWQSWMRLSGVDFFNKGKSAAVCTWLGDVWIVDGIDQAEGELHWQRICTGLFQPLGIKVVRGSIFVTCRDQIARLWDTSGDREIDWIECFNSDHQVTEHFHEFAMGLQMDKAENLYYAKSARHAKSALVPHHGTLLRVSSEGSRTDILASGFRAANGVCLNPDGSFIVTDQEGHWNPKNRINWVRGEGPEEFFGNIFGFTPVTDESDEAMERPLCWITNAFDRSPSELLWVPQKAQWGPLNGSLLNLSYGYGKIYVVPHEFVDGQPQGGMCELPLSRFPTGVMRGRFHPINGQLYGCGMFAWGSHQQQSGGFYRVRYTGKPALLPLGLSAKGSQVEIRFSDPLDPETALAPEGYQVTTWDLQRSASYGSKHLGTKTLAVSGADLSDDGLAVTLSIPGLAPTRGMEIRALVKSSEGGDAVERVIHNTIHHLAP